MTTDSTPNDTVGGTAASTTTNVLLGGNGYLGREVTRQWLAADPRAQFLVVSSSRRNEFCHCLRESKYMSRPRLETRPPLQEKITRVATSTYSLQASTVTS